MGSYCYCVCVWVPFLERGGVGGGGGVDMLFGTVDIIICFEFFVY